MTLTTRGLTIGRHVQEEDEEGGKEEANKGIGPHHYVLSLSPIQPESISFYTCTMPATYRYKVQIGKWNMRAHVYNSPHTLLPFSYNRYRDTWAS